GGGGGGAGGGDAPRGARGGGVVERGVRPRRGPPVHAARHPGTGAERPAQRQARRGDGEERRLAVRADGGPRGSGYEQRAALRGTAVHGAEPGAARRRGRVTACRRARSRRRTGTPPVRREGSAGELLFPRGRVAPRERWPLSVPGVVSVFAEVELLRGLFAERVLEETLAAAGAQVVAEVAVGRLHLLGIDRALFHLAQQVADRF